MTLHARSTGTSLPTPDAAAAQGKSAVVYRLGGRSYPMKTVPQCRVCQSQYRVEIERALLKSYGYTAIWRTLPEAEQEQVSVRSITEHAHRHLPVEESVRNAVVTARAREIGIDIEASESALIDHISFAKVGLQQVYEDMRDGRLYPDVKDGIAFANLLLKVQEVGGEGADQEAFTRGFMQYLIAMKAVCTQEQMAQIKNMLSADPVMKALWARNDRIIEHGEIE